MAAASINNETLKEGYILRPATLDDAPGVLEIMRACDIAVTGHTEESLEPILNEWALPGMKPETNVRVISAPDGRLVGYAIVQDSIRPVRPEVDVYVHPDFWGDTFDSILLDWVERRCRENIPHAPADARVAMNAYAYSKDSYYKSILENAGMQLIRHFFRMMIDLDQPLAQPEWPDGFQLRIFQPDDDKRAVLEAQRGSFIDHWGYVLQPFESNYETWSHLWSENFDPSLWFLAMDGDQIAGICLCLPQRGDDESLGWVRTLGVTRPYRRMGIGIALLLTAFQEFKKRGKTRVGLGVDASSLTGATRLYEKAGMAVAERFDLYEKELRPGVEYGTQSVE